MKNQDNDWAALMRGLLRSSAKWTLVCLPLAGCSKDREFASDPGQGSGGSSSGRGGTAGVGGRSGTGGSAGAVGGGAGGSVASGGSAEAGAGAGAGEGGGPQGDCTPSQTERCWETEDGKVLPNEPKEERGSCRFGIRTCDASGEWGACLGAVAPRDADSCEPGADESCNGVPNEGCPCTDGDTRACGEDKGNCQQGMQACENGAWTACEGGVRPAAQDSCSVEGDDADCDGVPNGGCPCVGNAKQACGDCGERTCDPAARDWGACRGTGTSKTCWETEAGAPLPGSVPEAPKGNCRLGQRACQSDGKLGACIGAVPPAAADSCSVPGDDATCDGVANGGCPCTGNQSRPCGSDVGACVKGTQSCVSGSWGACTGEVAAQAQDRCDVQGDDSNCNGVPNEGCPCVGTQSEACNDCGTRTCNPAARAWGACSAPQSPAATRCATGNGAVETCNSSGRWASTSCTAPSAQCTSRCEVSSSVARCVVRAVDADSDSYGTKLCTQAPGNDCDDARGDVHPGATEACDGVDNDCDGNADLADGLTLSGKNEAVGGSVTGRKRPSVTWAEELRAYGLLWAGDPASTADGDLRIETIDQSGKSTMGPISINAAEDVSTKATALAWGTDRFGTLFQTGDDRVVFLQVSSQGRPGTKLDVNTSPSVSGNSYSLARHSASGNWAFAFNTCFHGCLIESRTLISTSLSPLVQVSGAQSNAAVVPIPNGFMLGYMGATAPKAEIRDSGLNTLGDGPTLSGANPVFGAAPGGGFAVVTTRDGSPPSFASFNKDGSVLCAARSVGDANFLPAGVIGTDNGYLIASSGAVRVQLVSTACVPGPIVSLGSTSAGTVRVAGGGDGYAVVWDGDNSTLWRRFFGPRMCN